MLYSRLFAILQLLIENLYGFSGTCDWPPPVELCTCWIEMNEDCESVNEMFDIMWSETPATRVSVGIESANLDLSEVFVKLVNLRFLISLLTIWLNTKKS